MRVQKVGGAGACAEGRESRCVCACVCACVCCVLSATALFVATQMVACSCSGEVAMTVRNALHMSCVMRSRLLSASIATKAWSGPHAGGRP